MGLMDYQAIGLGLVSPMGLLVRCIVNCDGNKYGTNKSSLLTGELGGIRDADVVFHFRRTT